MKPIGRRTISSGKFTGLGIAQQFANAVCHFLRNHRRARPHPAGGTELPIDHSTWRRILDLEYGPTHGQSLQSYCDYYNGGVHGHGYDLDGKWDCGTGYRHREQQKGQSINGTNRTVHPGSRSFLEPMEVIAIVRRRLPQIPRLEGRRNARRLKSQWRHLEETSEFDPVDDRDARRRILAAIVRRYGSERFREALFNAYQGRCAISGCNVPNALEAAHIKPYNGPNTNHVTNGLLLRADIHTLFDLNLVGVEPSSLRFSIAPALLSSEYQKYYGKMLASVKRQMPASKQVGPRVPMAGICKCKQEQSQMKQPGIEAGLSSAF